MPISGHPTAIRLRLPGSWIGVQGLYIISDRNGPTDATTTLRYIHCEDYEMWLGYFEELPDYLTQGESLGELRRTLVISTGTSQAVIKPA